MPDGRICQAPRAPRRGREVAWLEGGPGRAGGIAAARPRRSPRRAPSCSPAAGVVPGLDQPVAEPEVCVRMATDLASGATPEATAAYNSLPVRGFNPSAQSEQAIKFAPAAW